MDPVRTLNSHEKPSVVTYVHNPGVGGVDPGETLPQKLRWSAVNGDTKHQPPATHKLMLQQGGHGTIQPCGSQELTQVARLGSGCLTLLAISRAPRPSL